MRLLGLHGMFESLFGLDNKIITEVRTEKYKSFKFKLRI